MWWRRLVNHSIGSSGTSVASPIPHNVDCFPAMIDELLMEHVAGSVSGFQSGMTGHMEDVHLRCRILLERGSAHQFGVETDTLWTPWTPWTPCARPCIIYRLVARDCTIKRGGLFRASGFLPAKLRYNDQHGSAKCEIKGADWGPVSSRGEG